MPTPFRQTPFRQTFGKWRDQGRSTYQAWIEEENKWWGMKSSFASISLSSRKGTRTTGAAKPTRTPQNPSHHPARSDRQNLRKPHNETTHSLGVTGLHTTSLNEKLSLHAIRSATQIIQMRRDIEHNPQKYPSNTPGGGVQDSVSQPPDPHWKASPYFNYPGEMLFLFASIGWCRTQNNILS